MSKIPGSPRQTGHLTRPLKKQNAAQERETDQVGLYRGRGKKSVKVLVFLTKSIHGGGFNRQHKRAFMAI